MSKGPTLRSIALQNYNFLYNVHKVKCILYKALGLIPPQFLLSIQRLRRHAHNTRKTVVMIIIVYSTDKKLTAMAALPNLTPLKEDHTELASL